MAKTRCSINKYLLVKWRKFSLCHEITWTYQQHPVSRSPSVFLTVQGDLQTYNSHSGRMLSLNPNFISKQTQSLSLCHCVWSQMKPSTPSKKGQRENSHTRYIKNRYQKSSFHSCGFTMTIFCIGWGWINPNLSREDAIILQLSEFGLDLGSWAIGKGLGLNVKGLNLYPAASASLLCFLCFMGWLSVLLKFYRRKWTLSWFLSSHETI